MRKQRHEIRVSEKQIDAALAAARQFASSDRRVVKAEYRPDPDEFRLGLADGEIVSIPRPYLQGLENADRGQLSKIEIVGNGTGLHWPLLHVDHYMLGLLQGIWGTRRWMAAIGRKGGSSTSAAKAKAARSNGRAGGRPRRKSALKTRVR